MWRNLYEELMKHYLISEAIGDIAGSAYEGRAHRIKDYNMVKLFSSRAHFTDDTVLTFACAEAFIDHLDMVAMPTPSQPSQALWPMPITKRCLMSSSIKP